MSERVTVRLSDETAEWLDATYDARSHGVREALEAHRADLATDDDDAPTAYPEPDRLARAYDVLTERAGARLPLDAATSILASELSAPADVVRATTIPRLESAGYVSVRQGMYDVTLRVKPPAADPVEWTEVVD